MPRACQKGRRTAVTSGHQRTPRTASDLGLGRLTPCLKRPSKQPVMNRPSGPDGEGQAVRGQTRWGRAANFSQRCRLCLPRSRALLA